jgi:hypothetical protein
VAIAPPSFDVASVSCLEMSAIPDFGKIEYSHVVVESLAAKLTCSAVSLTILANWLLFRLIRGSEMVTEAGFSEVDQEKMKVSVFMESA